MAALTQIGRANFLDRAIAVVSPRAAAERLYYRSLYDQARAYDGAKSTRRTEGWIATGTSANAETMNGLDRLRWRARELERNNAQAAGILRKLPGYMVGAGITVRASDGDKPRLNKNWKRFLRTSDVAGGTNFNAQMYLAARTIARDGEVLLVWHDTPDPTRPLALHVLEADHLDTQKTIELSNAGNIVIQGVEFDRNSGARVAYWLFDQHPGEPLSVTSRKFQSRRVPASRVDHIFDILRPGQARGVPWSAPVALRMRDIAEYEDAELIRKKIEACFSVFITRTDADGSLPAGPGPQTIDGTTGNKVDRLTPGMIQRLQIGEDVSFGEPRQSIAVSDYLKTQWLSVTFGMGVPYSMGTGDLSNANYSSQREGRLDFWILLDNWQWNMIIAMGLEKAWQRVGEANARLGQGPGAGEFPEAAYAPPKREWVDPEKDGRATMLKIRSGLLPWPAAVAETGEDPEEQLATLKEWQTKLEPLDLDFSATGANVAAPGGAPGARDPNNPDGTEPDAAADPANPVDEPPPADDSAAAAGRLAESVDLLNRAMALRLASVTPPPVVNVAAPVVNLTVQESVEGERELVVTRDGNNRLTGGRLVPAKRRAKRK